MRIVNWLFLVSVMLFICGVGFVIAAARTSRTSRTVAPAGSDLAPPLVPVASIKQIMNGIVDPAAQRIYMSVGTNSTKNGIETYGPKTDDDWTKLGNDAAAIIESGNLLLIGNRAVDNGDWIKMTHAMVDAAKGVLKATQDKKMDAVLSTGGDLNTSCDNCHDKYQRE
jgi:cytochrome c553